MIFRRRWIRSEALGRLAKNSGSLKAKWYVVLQPYPAAWQVALAFLADKIARLTRKISPLMGLFYLIKELSSAVI